MLYGRTITDTGLSLLAAALCCIGSFVPYTTKLVIFEKTG